MAKRNPEVAFLSVLLKKLSLVFSVLSHSSDSLSSMLRLCVALKQCSEMTGQEELSYCNTYYDGRIKKSSGSLSRTTGTKHQTPVGCKIGITEMKILIIVKFVVVFIVTLSLTLIFL